MDDTAPNTEQLVYIGRARAASGKLAHWYRPVAGDALDPERQVGTLKRYALSPIGAIVTVHRPAGQPERIYTAGQYAPEISGAWHDEAAINEWRTIDRAEYQRDANETRARKQLAGLPDEFSAALDTLATHFSRLNHSQRAALLSLVQAKLLRG